MRVASNSGSCVKTLLLFVITKSITSSTNWRGREGAETQTGGEPAGGEDGTLFLTAVRAGKGGVKPPADMQQEGRRDQCSPPPKKKQEGNAMQSPGLQGEVREEGSPAAIAHRSSSSF